MLIENILKFDTNSLRKCIDSHHANYDFPVKDIAAENILANFFEANQCTVGWQAGSHKPGSDVFIYGETISGWSVKSGKEPINGEWFKISSYRTGSAQALEAKKESIRKIEKDINGYVIFARVEQKNASKINVHYNVYIIYPEVLAIDTFDMSPQPDEKGNFSGQNNLGVKILIAKNMSYQVWYSVPMTLVKENKLICKLCEANGYVMKLRKERKQN